MHTYKPFIIVSGPSGSGKTTTVDIIIEEYGGYVDRIVTCTTRDQRPHEIAAKDYHYLTREEFLAIKSDNGFVETSERKGNLYGTRMRDIEPIWDAGKIPIAAIDQVGVACYRALFPGSLSLGLMPARMDELAPRIQELRPGGTAKDTAERLALAGEEFLLLCENADFIIAAPTGKVPSMVKRMMMLIKHYKTYGKTF